MKKPTPVLAIGKSTTQLKALHTSLTAQMQTNALTLDERSAHQYASISKLVDDGFITTI